MPFPVLPVQRRYAVAGAARICSPPSASGDVTCSGDRRSYLYWPSAPAPDLSRSCIGVRSLWPVQLLLRLRLAGASSSRPIWLLWSCAVSFFFACFGAVSSLACYDHLALLFLTLSSMIAAPVVMWFCSFLPNCYSWLPCYYFFVYLFSLCRCVTECVLPCLFPVLRLHFPALTWFVPCSIIRLVPRGVALLLFPSLAMRPTVLGRRSRGTVWPSSSVRPRAVSGWASSGAQDNVPLRLGVPLRPLAPSVPSRRGREPTQFQGNVRRRDVPLLLPRPVPPPPSALGLHVASHGSPSLFSPMLQPPRPRRYVVVS